MTGAARRRLVVESDGGSRGNPGVAGYGAVVRDRHSGSILLELAEPLGTTTNNVAEYRGLLAGLQAAAEIDPGAEVIVRMDSDLIVKQMTGVNKVKHPNMRPLALEAQRICQGIRDSGGSVDFEWVPRERNKTADALSNEAMDGHSVRRDHRDAVEGPGPSAVTDERQGSPAPSTTGLRLLLVQVPGDESQVAGVAAAALELLSPDSRVVAVGAPLARQVAEAVAAPLRADVEVSDTWVGGSGTAGADGRVLAAYHSLVDEGGTVAVVTTRPAVLTVLAEVLGLATDRFWAIATAPGSLSAVEVWPDGTASVAFTNRTAQVR